MVVDSLANAQIYHSLIAGAEAGFGFLEAFDPAVPDGRYDLDDARVFALVQSYDTAPGAEKRFESHRAHVDIQYVVEGRERILWAPAGSLDVDEPYDDAGDVAFYRDPATSSSVLLRAGDFAIFLPHDGHKPGCMAGGRERVRKIVIKVRI
jgi:biofilm protein TabA